MRIMLFTLMWVASAAAFSATVYKWVDENGVVHYSDQPHENAQKLTYTSPPTYTPSATANVAQTTSAPEKPAAAYQSCAIQTPTNDEMLMNAFELSASVALSPAERPGDQIAWVLDGQKVGASDTQITVPVDRGTHSLQAVVMDSDGKPVCQSSVTFHVHQASTQNPQSSTKK